MAMNYNILTWEPHGQYEKAKKIWYWKLSPRLKVSSMLLGKTRGQLLIAPERMKQKQKHLVVDVSCGKEMPTAVKNNIAQEPRMLGT